VAYWHFFENQDPLHGDENFLVITEDPTTPNARTLLLEKYPQNQGHEFIKYIGYIPTKPADNQKWYIWFETDHCALWVRDRDTTDRISFEIRRGASFCALIVAENIEFAKQLLHSRVCPLNITYVVYGGQFPEMKPTVTIHNVSL
jgi:hypothetical protein